MKVTGKAALMVDLSVKYDEFPKEGSDFSEMRDSLYILCIMNQCKLCRLRLASYFSKTSTYFSENE